MPLEKYIELSSFGVLKSKDMLNDMDAGLLNPGILNTAYFKSRVIITSVVILSLLCAAALL